MRIGYFTSPALDGNGLAEVGDVLRRQFFAGDGDIVDANFSGRTFEEKLLSVDCPKAIARH